ncbi:hypothetical protein ACETK8_20070 (plasmid) [Brevundimonas staleyi]|uniref:Uncharacterized protein n=1 Tax=Brevundimonas staleyi TaxID=74326 RepID=A0ABW0FME2_9CAUL
MSWIIARGDGYAFEVRPDPTGPFARRVEALEDLLGHLLADRRELNAAIARARRMRRAAGRSR